MGKINGCLKCLLNIINIFFLILMCLLIRAITSNKQSTAAGWGGLILGWVFAFTVTGISCLGIYGSCMERESALRRFAGFMSTGLFIMLSQGTYFAIRRHTVKNEFTNEVPEAFKSYMEDDEYRAMLNKTQADAKCCGLSRAEDWGSDIPESCACSGLSGGLGLGECEPRPQNTTGPDQVYAKTCRNDLFKEIDLNLKSSMEGSFMCAAIPLFELVVSIMMIEQVKPFEPNLNMLMDPSP